MNRVAQLDINQPPLYPLDADDSSNPRRLDQCMCSELLRLSLDLAYLGIGMDETSENRRAEFVVLKVCGVVWFTNGMSGLHCPLHAGKKTWGS